MSIPGQGNDKKRKREASPTATTKKSVKKGRSSRQIRKIVEDWLGTKIKHAPSDCIEVILKSVKEENDGLILPDGLDRIATIKLLKEYLRYTKNLISARRSRKRKKLYVAGLEKTIQTLLLSSSKQPKYISSLRTKETIDDFKDVDNYDKPNSLVMNDYLDIQKFKIEAEQTANNLYNEIRGLHWRLLLSEKSLVKVKERTNQLENQVKQLESQLRPMNPVLNFSEAEEWWSKMFINVY